MRAFTAWASVLVLLPVLALAQEEDAYEIGPDDILSVAVAGQAGLTGDFTVDREGTLVLPVLGKVKASEMTAPELERKLTTLLAEGYLKRPQVSVSVKEFRSAEVFVIGEVSRPGPYPLGRDRSLRTLLASTVLGPNAGHEVVVKRPYPSSVTPAEPASVSSEIPSDQDAPVPVAAAATSTPEVFRFNLNAVRVGDPSAKMVLQRGDTVEIPPARQVYVLGHVNRPGAYRYQEAMTVLQALMLAGGVAPRGSEGRVKVTRIVEGERKQFKVKLDDLVGPEDTIVVPERWF